MAERAAFKKIIILISILFLAGCANQLPPGGGEVDRTPPEIVEIFPQDQTVNYADNSFKIKFSEYVNKRSVQESVFISPNIEGEIEYDWSGTSVEIVLPDSLLENTTYTITIGTDVEDINNSNKMESAYTFAFSTGDKIDKGKITGNVIDESAAGIMIYSYKITNDTLNPEKMKPDYISQTGENGSFRLSGLSDGIYRVFALRDEYKDFVYNPTQDAFGVPYADVKLDTTNPLAAGMNFYMQIADTTAPRVNNVTMTDKHHMLIEFSEAVDSTKIASENFYIYDSLNNEKIDVTYFYKGKTKKNNFLIAFSDTVKTEESVYLVAQNIYDLKNNLTLKERTPVAVNDKPDTTRPANSGFVTQYSNSEIDFINGWIKLNYDDGFDIAIVENAVTVSDNNKQHVKYQVQKIDDASFKLIFDKLKPFSDYSVQVDQNYFADVAGNKIDSTFTYNFSTINDLEFSGVSGTVVKPEQPPGNIIVLIENLADKSITQRQSIEENTFNFQRVVPGEYFLWAYIDINDNKIYDKGNIYPFEPSERFIFYSDTLNLRPRWPVGDIELIFEND